MPHENELFSSVL